MLPLIGILILTCGRFDIRIFSNVAMFWLSFVNFHVRWRLLLFLVKRFRKINNIISTKRLNYYKSEAGLETRNFFFNAPRFILILDGEKVKEVEDLRLRECCTDNHGYAGLVENYH